MVASQGGNRRYPRCLLVIPARGGSKGIPGKNLQMVGGLTLLERAIDTASGAALGRVVVSTNDEAIANVARARGAEVVLRPEVISKDTSTTEEALLHVVETLCHSSDEQPELLVLLQCTSPFTSVEDVRGTVMALVDAQADSSLAVTPFHSFIWATADGSALGVNHDCRHRLRRQDLPKQFKETGGVYVMRIPGFLAARFRFFGKIATYVTPPERCLEIDDPADLFVANAIATTLSETRL